MERLYGVVVNLMYVLSCGCIWTTALCGSDVRGAERTMARRVRARRLANDDAAAAAEEYDDPSVEDERLLHAHCEECGCLDEKAPRTDIDDFVDTARTGDLVLFCARSLTAHIIERFTHSHFCHVGMVWRPAYAPHHPVLLEANGHVLLGKKMHKGPNGLALRRRLHEAVHGQYSQHYSAVYVRRLDAELPHSNQPNTLYVLRTFSHEYRASIKDFIFNVYDGPMGALQQREPFNKRREFCSEYIAELYKHMRLLPENVSDEEYAPRDFAYPALLYLKNGQRLSKHSRLV